MKIALVAKKGGVGKTTLCLLLYEAFKRAERTVAVRDYDAQGSASKALDAFGGQKESPGQTYDILIIDTPLPRYQRRPLLLLSPRQTSYWYRPHPLLWT